MSDKIFSKSLDRQGWPWDIETDSKIYSSDAFWPKISIITPSYNQGEFLEETIRSVLLQNYPNLDYIIIDGGSTDDSVQIIKRYENFIGFWVSEKDFGQSHAINKGIYHSQGEIINWINSDDILLQDSLFQIAKEYMKLAREEVVLIGHGYEIDENSKLIRERRVEIDGTDNNNLHFKVKGLPIQQSIFFSRKILIEAGGINPLIKYPMDIDLYKRIDFLKPKVLIIDNYLGGFRKHAASKTMSQNFLMMEEKISLLKFLSFYDPNKDYYNDQIVSYIIGTSFNGAEFQKRLKYLFLALRYMQLGRKKIYKYRILFSKIFE